MICTICKRDLPESDFYPSFIRRKQHQCRKCSYEKWGKKAQKKYTDSIKEYPDREFENICGGYVITILNYSKPSESRYAIKSTNGEIFTTNSSEKFMEEIKMIISRYTP